MAKAAQPSARRNRKLTAEESMRLSDDGRKYELVDGEPKAVPAGVKHDVIGVELAVRLKPLVAEFAYIGGARQVWLLFPKRKRVIVYTSPFDAVAFNEDDILTTPLIPKLQVRVGDLFEL